MPSDPTPTRHTVGGTRLTVEELRTRMGGGAVSHDRVRAVVDALDRQARASRHDDQTDAVGAYRHASQLVRGLLR